MMGMELVGNIDYCLDEFEFKHTNHNFHYSNMENLILVAYNKEESIIRDVLGLLIDIKLKCKWYVYLERYNDINNTSILRKLEFVKKIIK